MEIGNALPPTLGGEKQQKTLLIRKTKMRRSGFLNKDNWSILCLVHTTTRVVSDWLSTAQHG